MVLSRDNHYVPEWHQRHFIEPRRDELYYLDLNPEKFVRRDGSIVLGRSLFRAPVSRCFVQRDLYSTFFGGVIDEIERKLFGAIDTRGSKAIPAFMATEEAERSRHFETLFEYIDIQKIRTPKGLDWLRSQYPGLDQNELMMEMQAIRMLHGGIWANGVREVVSAEQSAVKFILTDHPVTIYNHGAPPGSTFTRYPEDPSIALKGSQTLFPLSRNFCLILTNLEYARDPGCRPLEKRTFARNFHDALVNTMALIHERHLIEPDVVRINRILKLRARRFVAAGREEWLFPEKQNDEPWSALGEPLKPPANQLHEFGGEIYVRYTDGHVHYQDEFGRTEKERSFLLKPLPDGELRPSDACGCGSGETFRDCCRSRPEALRPAWDELSIRERNLRFYHGILNILGLSEGKSWTDVRRTLTEEQIRQVYTLFAALWPLETDLLKLLPKPDGRPRAVYTGSTHPFLIDEFATGAPLYFGELIIENPFAHPGVLAKAYSPLEQPGSYHHEFLKSVVFILNIMPLVDAGLVNLIPDPCIFDTHLRRQMMKMAEDRAGLVGFEVDEDPRLKKLAIEGLKRDLLALPDEAIIAELRRDKPGIGAEEISDLLVGRRILRERDPLAVLQDGIVGASDRGQLHIMKLAPNFEIAMYLAQATGAAIVTDSPHRWQELKLAIRPRFGPLVAALDGLAAVISRETFLFSRDPVMTAKIGIAGAHANYPALFKDSFRYLARLRDSDRKTNWEASAAARFTRLHRSQGELEKAGVPIGRARISCAFPARGIQDNTINRLLLMSSSEQHLPSVPMAFFIEPFTAVRQ